MQEATRLVRPRTVTADGDGLVSHAGLVWLGEVADRTGLTAGLSAAMAERPRRRHDPGVTLGQMVLALADGATCVSDVAVLRDQPGLFGPVASHPAAWRTIAGLAPGEYRRLAGARAQARAAAWAAGAGPAGDEVIIDVDATLVTTKADKQDAAATYKRSYGHHPLLAMCAETGEVLTVMLRAGNAGSNTAADHVITLGAALAQLPRRGGPGTSPVTSTPRRPSRCWSEPTRPGPATGSPKSAGTATSATASASTSTTASATPLWWSRKRTGNPPSGPAADDGPVPRSSNSPAWSTLTPGRTPPG